MVAPVHLSIMRHHLSLVVSNDRPKAPDRRTEYLSHAYACHDMALRADDVEDRTALRGMTAIWLILAQRTASARA